MLIGDHRPDHRPTGATDSVEEDLEARELTARHRRSGALGQAWPQNQHDQPRGLS